MASVVERDLGLRVPLDPAWTSLVLLDALLLSIAAGVHGSLAPAHAREAVLLGVGFSLTAALQLGCALLLLFRPSRTLLRLIIGVGALAVGAWAISRTIGLPGSLGAGSPEPVGLVDLGTAAVELASAVLSAILATGRLRLFSTRALPAIRASLALAGGLGLFMLIEAQGHAGSGASAAHEAGHLLLAALIAGASALIFGVRWLVRRFAPASVTLPSVSGP